MLITIKNSPSKVYFVGVEPKFTYYRMRLISRYSNQNILNDGIVWSGNKYFNLVLSDNQDEWYSFLINWTNTDLEIKDLEGYYTAIFEHSTNNTTWTEWDRRLVKVVNEWDDNLYVEYSSNNENNIQFINYEDA